MVSTMKSTLEDRFRTGQKLQRRGTKHVKSGCRTCKVRRVKCDETRPACGRCTSTGRTCDGYGIWSTSAGTGISHGFHQRQSPSSVVSTTPPRDTIEYGWCMSPLLDGNCKMFNLLDRRVDADELVCLDFFRLRCLVKLPGFFDASFWEKTVPQVSSSAPAVFHAVVALASTQRSQEYTSCMRKGPDNPFIDYDSEIKKWDRFALQQYNKSIIRLQSYFEDDGHESVQIALITCVLFICIELMRGSYTRANVHIDHVINVLKTLQRKRHSSDSLPRKQHREIVRVTDPKTVDDHLLEILARMNTQCVLFGYPSRYIHLTEARTNLVGTIPDVFDSLQECRQYLEVLLNKSLHLINKSSGSTPSFSLGEPEYHFPETREQLIETLAQWKCAYEKLTQKVRPNITVYAYIALNLLRIWSLKVEIMLRTCPATNEPWNEMAFDKYTHLFEEILSASDDVVLMRGFPGNFVLQDAKCHTGPLNFSADMGPVPVLYYIALKCRVPSIKRRAIQALRAAPHREAVWDGIAVAAAAETVIRLEEGDFFGVFNDAYPSVAYSLSSVQKDVLPEWSRFQDVRIIMEDGLQLGGTIIGRRKREDSNIFSSFLGEDDSSKWEPVEEPFQCGERLSTYTWSNIQDMYKAANLSSA
ncbi:hypothetical protein EYB26_007878 [Talaromyces marneffei]|uniref:uncharacterized protein n=1 Tax=Talaromyces marneffei TaxID=37727 RepID=UPI0012AA441E|nr:uncharacterized protein EYB26_007878 [Talaromyces marneffei]QGA20177.1 hypothetical protein EYB26_007878 [Talaromyces marneffei]